jgi:DUF971 family protein
MKTSFFTGSILSLCLLSSALAQAADAALDFGDDQSQWANDGECDDPRFSGAGSAAIVIEQDRLHDASDCRDFYESGLLRVVVEPSTLGELSAGAREGQLQAGVIERYRFQGGADDILTLDLRAKAIDTYLTVITPSGERLSNDDYEGDLKYSHLVLVLSEPGDYLVEATSYDSHESGAYTLELALAKAIAANEYSGSLDNGDTSYDKGEYYDSWNFEGEADQIVAIDLYSEEFDTYLVLKFPDGDREVNDDSNIDGTSSQIVRRLPATGTYTVRVTSYEVEESGAYTLRIVQSVSE